MQVGILSHTCTPLEMHFTDTKAMYNEMSYADWKGLFSAQSGEEANTVGLTLAGAE